MLDWLKHALEWLKTPGYYFLPLLAVSAFGLFAPPDILDQLGITQWRTDGKFYLGSVFVISFAIVAVHYGSQVIQWLSGKYRVFLSHRAAHARLKSLTAEEKEFLSGYLKEETRIQRHFVHSAVAAVLMRDNIIYAAVDEGLFDNFPFTITSWAWEYLHKNPHLVGIKAVTHVNNP
ncbi:MAG: superinfection exclusion B family protein [Methylobacter sp.]|nr:superinfection exclusion B family protein [Methylobacter sp.]